jgi:hypothetical protein
MGKVRRVDTLENLQPVMLNLACESGFLPRALCWAFPRRSEPMSVTWVPINTIVCKGSTFSAPLLILLPNAPKRSLRSPRLPNERPEFCHVGAHRAMPLNAQYGSRRLWRGVADAFLAGPGSDTGATQRRGRLARASLHSLPVYHIALAMPPYCAAAGPLVALDARSGDVRSYDGARSWPWCTTDDPHRPDSPYWQP